MASNAKRDPNRKCGLCGRTAVQSKMVRTNNSPNGWVCRKCRDDYNHAKNVAKKQGRRGKTEWLHPVDEVDVQWRREQAFCFDY